MSSYVTRKTPGDTSWFVRDRFGMFIPFGRNLVKEYTEDLRRLDAPQWPLHLQLHHG